MSGAATVVHESGSPIVRIGEWLFDPSAGRVESSAGVRRLEPRVCEVLQHLIEHRGETVSKEELLRTVWKDTAVVDDVVWRCIAQLRRAFDDDSRDPRFIATIPRRGYRLIASVTIVEPSVPTLASAAGAPTGALSRRLAPLAAVLVFVVIAVATGGRIGVPGSTAVGDDVQIGSSPPSTWRAEDFVRAGREYYVRRDEADLRRALELFEQAVALDPASTAGWAGLADVRAQLGDRLTDLDLGAAALRAADRAVGLDARLPEAHKARGLALATLGRTTEAIDAYRQALARDPGFVPARANLAILLAEVGEYDEALAVHVALGPAVQWNAVDLHNIGDALYHVGRLPEAREHLRAALSIDPLQVESVSNLARMDLIDGAIDAARVRVERALAQQPGQRRLLIAAAEIATVGGDLARADELFRTALQDGSPSHDAEAWVRWIWVQRELGDPTAGQEMIGAYMAALRQVISEHGTWRAAQLGAAIALLDGDRPQALALLQQALDLGTLEFRWLPVDPLFRDLRTGSEFIEMLERAGSRWQDNRMIANALAQGPLRVSRSDSPTGARR